MELVLDRVLKQYGNKIAVDRISTVFQPGVIGLLGANGAGKTTLMRESSIRPFCVAEWIRFTIYAWAIALLAALRLSFLGAISAVLIILSFSFLTVYRTL